jgi:hypothetical protein
VFGRDPITGVSRPIIFRSMTMRRLLHIPSSLCIATALAAGAAATAQEALPENGTNTIVQQYGDIPYVTGGISDSDVQRTQELARGMNVQLVFALMNGDYLADVDVVVQDARGREVLRVEGADPLLFARVPPGRYVVKAEVEGKPLERRIEVGASGREVVYLHWRGPM